MRFYPLERLINLYDGYCQRFQVGSATVLLIQDQGQCFVINNHCPHLGQPLDRATVKAGTIRCPAHGFEFDLSTGLQVLHGVRSDADGRNDVIRCPALTRYEICYDGPYIGLYG